ncbi:6437_t:CDS:2 [Cetraspora pellucida]|uniref:6437_t:CDS:1 n=1 Tax=Cetraspora pellucida TaxID=1433469 RepID=A0A9N9J0N4_9GLOM|nr:6437_t:CDS:2 [Cetraspora pellucida]
MLEENSVKYEKETTVPGVNPSSKDEKESKVPDLIPTFKDVALSTIKTTTEKLEDGIENAATKLEKLGDDIENATNKIENLESGIGGKIDMVVQEISIIKSQIDKKQSGEITVPTIDAKELVNPPHPESADLRGLHRPLHKKFYKGFEVANLS